MSHGILPCPFCGMRVSDDLIDTLYPTGLYWRDTELGHVYPLRDQVLPDDNPIMGLHCNESYGGCGVVMQGDTKQEVIRKWNRRTH